MISMKYGTVRYSVTYKSRTVQHTSNNACEKGSAVKLSHVSRHRHESIRHWGAFMDHIYVQGRG